MQSNTAMMPNKNKFHSLFFYSSVLLEVSGGFQTDHLPEGRISFCGAETWTGLSVPHIIPITSFLNLP